MICHFINVIPSMYHNINHALNMTCNKAFDNGPTIVSLSQTKSYLVHIMHSYIYIYTNHTKQDS